MLNLFPSVQRDCQGIHRRSFLQVGALAGLGLSLPGWLKQKQAAAAEGRPSRDVNCILIWSTGGASHIDTFDPKPDAPDTVRGEFDVIDTAVLGVKFTEVCPTFAREAQRFAILRGWNPRNNNHGQADAYVMSGHKINPILVYPTYGSIVAREKGFKNALPPFVQLGEGIDGRFGGGTAGYLGMEYNPFIMSSDPNEADFTIRDITPPKGVDSGRIERRRKMIGVMGAMQKKVELQPAAFAALDEHYEAALNMITAKETKQAFELSKENDDLRDAYGRNKLGQSCLLARRLIESGVRFATVVYGGWDTHANNFNTLKEKRMPAIDKALPALLIDLEQRGLLETTLVVWLSDFGRTPKINVQAGRDHWGNAGFAFMAGAGTPGGSVLGRTDDEGGVVTHDQYYTEDIAATIYSKIGISPDLLTTTPDGRPIRVNEGRPIREWM